jgi:hypothetical protein
MLISDPVFLTNLEFTLPFGAFFSGIAIRKVALNKSGSPPLFQQFLLGIPLSLVMVSPVLYMFEAALEKVDHVGAISAYLINLGLVMTSGMAVPEVATKHLRKWIQQVAARDPFEESNEHPSPSQRRPARRAASA